jgi:hypothetical protein
MAAEQQSSRSSSIISPASNQLGPGPHFQINWGRVHISAVLLPENVDLTDLTPFMFTRIAIATTMTADLHALTGGIGLARITIFATPKGVEREVLVVEI